MPLFKKLQRVQERMGPRKIKRLEVEKRKVVKSIGIEVVQSTHTDFYFDVSLFLFLFNYEPFF